MKIKSLLLIACLLIANLSFGQTKFNSKGQQYGVIKVKFNENQQKTLEKYTKSMNKLRAKDANFSGVIPVGIQKFDALNKQYSASNMKRIFRYAGKNETNHIEYGLHLWYEIQLDSKANLDKLAKEYSSLAEITNVAFSYNASIIGFGSNEKTKGEFIPDDPQFKDQWHYKNTGQTGGTVGADINVTKAWELVTGNPNVVVAITDLGIDYDHVDLKGNMWINEDEIPGNNVDDDNNGYVDDYYGYNFNQDKGEIVTGDHGTHVAGTISAETNNGIGVAGVAGGSGKDDGVRLMSCQVLVSNTGEVSAEAFPYAADNGAVISQNSWGFDDGELVNGQMPGDFVDAIDYFIATAGGDDAAMKGGIVICAAGNNNQDGDFYPAKYEPCVAVSALDNNNKKASFSNYGTWVDVAAPGTNIISSYPNDKYGQMSGTSMACPHVSGVAALVLSRAYGVLTNDELRTILIQSVNDIDDINSSYAGKLGSGIIDAFKAVSAAESEPPTTPENLKALTVEAGRISLSWNKVSKAVYYIVQARKQGESWVTYEEQMETSIVISTEANSTYEVQVKARNFAGESSYCSPISVNTPDWEELTDSPKNIAAPIVKFDKVKFTWDHVSGSQFYDAQFRKQGGNWTEFNNITNNELEASTSQITTYEFRVRAKNPVSTTEYSSIFTVTTPDITYCDATGANTAFSYIINVKLGSIDNTSGDDGGYGDYTNLSTDIEAGVSYTFTVEGSGTARYAAWIDFNQDGSFGADENIYQGQGGSNTFTTPSDITTGIVGMRVSQLQGGFNYPEPCDVPFFGEVEDYKINLIGDGSISCDIPNGLTVDNITLNGADVNWNTVISANSYTLRYRMVSTTTWTEQTISTNSYSLSSLLEGTDYEVQVSTNCDNGSSNYSSSVQFTTLAEDQCDIPTGLEVSNITLNSADIGWNKVANVNSYTLRYRIVGATTWSEVNASSNSYALSSLTEGTDYEVQVKTNCENGSSDYSSNVDFTTLSDEQCDIPTGLGVSNITLNSADVSWNSLANSNSYTLRYRVVGTTTWTEVNASSNSYALSNLNESTDYEVQVKTNCENGSSNYSSSVQFTTLSNNTDCHVPTGLAVSNITKNSTDVNWNEVSSASSYFVEYSMGGFFSYTKEASTNSITLSGLFPDYNYSVKVKAICGDEESDYCSPIAFKTKGYFEATQSISAICHPNPANDKLFTNFTFQNDGTYTFKLIDLTGRAVIVEQITTTKGTLLKEFDVSNLSNGMYKLIITDNKGNNATENIFIF